MPKARSKKKSRSTKSTPEEPKIEGVPADQPSPSDGKEAICKCYKSCGGPDRVGVWVSRPQKSRHKKRDQTYLARAGTISLNFAGTASGSGIPPSNPIEGGSITQIPNHFTPIGEDLPFLLNNEDDLINPNVPSNPHNDNIDDMPTNAPVSPHSTNTPSAEEEEYDPPDPDSLNDIKSQQPQPEPTGATTETDFTPVPTIESSVKEIRIADQFVRMLQAATINGPKADIEPLPSDFVHRL
ncbi:hypothetical protein PM082_023931 [Marasmius tenuissimus]|nr:hypothetical protein PM082_023931 [Marasmius tenuissimus]